MTNSAEWNLADAKNKLSELVNLTLTKGPQWIRRRKDRVVMLAVEEYERLAGKRPSFKDYLLKGESFDDLDLHRDESLSRDIVV